MGLVATIKKLNRRVSSDFIGSNKYWKKSPSNILLYEASKKALAEWAQDKLILDAGAGRLAYRELIKQFAAKYTSSDFMQTHPDLDVVTDIEDMPFKTGQFEVVFCSQVLEHVPHPWLAFGEIHRVLKKNGVAIITVPMLGYIHNAPYDFFRYTEFGLKNMAEDAGFTVKELAAIGGFFSFLGYVRSTLIMPLFGLPLVGDVIFWTNYLCAKLDIFLDTVVPNKRIFPLNYLLVVHKN